MSILFILSLTLSRNKQTNHCLNATQHNRNGVLASRCANCAWCHAAPWGCWCEHWPGVVALNAIAARLHEVEAAIHVVGFHVAV